MIKLFLVGMGVGDPEQLTLKGVRILNAVDLILIPRKDDDKTDLAQLRREFCARHVSNPRTLFREFDMPLRDEATPHYLSRVADWHGKIAKVWEKTIDSCGATGGEIRSAALLVWGDPSLYDSTLRIAARLSIPHEVEVVPGVSALQALTAAHKIPLNAIGAAFTVTTGRRLREQGFPNGVDRAAVLLDGDCAFQILDHENFFIWWGAYLGLPQQILISGALHDVCAPIIAARKAARAENGWIMDVYLLQRHGF